MSAECEAEQKQTAGQIAELEAQLNKRDCEVNNTAKFLDIVRKYSEITELTAPILNDLMDRNGVIEDGNHRLANALANNRAVDVVIFP